MKKLGSGAHIGVLGGGQLGRMFALEAIRLGYFVHVLDPDPAAPAARLAARFVRARFDDLDAVASLAHGVDVVTLEFENVPLAAAEAAARFAPLRPAPQALAATQNRLREKRFLESLGIAVARFAPVTSASDLATARERVPGAAVLKCAATGYDGKGQRLLVAREPLEPAWRDLGSVEAVLEERVALAAECSVLVARGADGETQCFGPIANVHEGGILDHSSWPAPLPRRVSDTPLEASEAIARALDFVGVLCVEWFVTRDGALLANEIAPRPHNSGHLTIEACLSSQFEQQVRTVCGLPLGSFAGIRPAAMANLLGDLWADGEPAFDGPLRDPTVALHLYGKRDPRPGRKMGHLTALADTASGATRRVLAARSQLRRGEQTRGGIELRGTRLEARWRGEIASPASAFA